MQFVLRALHGLALHQACCMVLYRTLGSLLHISHPLALNWHHRRSHAPSSALCFHSHPCLIKCIPDN